MQEAGSWEQEAGSCDSKSKFILRDLVLAQLPATGNRLPACIMQEAGSWGLEAALVLNEDLILVQDERWRRG